MSDTSDPFAARPYVPPSQQADTTAPDPEPDPGPDAGPFTHRYEDSATSQADSSAASEPVPTAASYAADPASTQQLPPAPPQSTAGGDEPPGRSKPAVAGLLAAALIGGAAGIGGSAVYNAFVEPHIGVVNTLDAPDNAGEAPQDATEQVATKLLPSVVEVSFKSGNSAGRGTGIIISSNGEILTNNHVVERVAKKGSLSVTFNDGSAAKARILGRDPFTDTAVIKAAGKSGLRPAVLGDSSKARVGQQVVVLGSPFGLAGSVTSGIISAVNRPQAFADTEGQLESSFPAIQTDAAFNVGNSGGPLADMDGRVLGISTVILSSGGGFDGVGFAIPINVAKNAAHYLEKGKPAQHARIGISLPPVGDEDELDQTPAEVKDVTPGSAGAKAGLRKGDVIKSVDDVRITSNIGVIAAIRGYRPGQTVTVTYERGGKIHTTKVKLDSDHAAGAPKD
ncbi:MAG TPA: trypsin-like peptidase domain-containing protein [Aeromicrobium sp.]|nr:trypsin-like peptidase domain-containing protein [Aeromicrobium sp.]